MDSVVVGSVVSTHLHVQLGYGTVEADVSEFLVHVVVAGSGLIPQNDSVSLDCLVVPFEDLDEC